MRLLFIFFVVLLCSCSKYTKLDGTYFSKEQDAFILDDKIGVMENKKDYILNNLLLKQTPTKIKFRRITYAPSRRLFKRSVDKYCFKLLHKTEDSFMVSPVSKLAKKYFFQRDSIVFKTKYHFADPTNFFTKIVYHSSHCFGCCKDLYLELDYSGNLKVTDLGSGRLGCKDSILNDHYFGKVSYDDMERLRSILKHSQLKTLEWPDERHCFDAPDITLILYQNDKCYYFKENLPCIPIVSWPLANFLSRLFRYSTLKKVDTTWRYEQ